ncbi:MAG: hypothetical protein FWD46_03735 [Cystobacterineae bacterium]|nr:hypothetical protein [Cystobacterineae bacterium]
MKTSLGLVAALCSIQVWAAPSLALFPSGQAETIHIVNWQANDLPKIYERSSQLPLTDAEVLSLVKAQFTPSTIIKMIEERRCACDASAEGLIRLKKAKVSEEILKAISLHALKPNRALHLLVSLEFSGTSREARQSYVYFFIEDGELTRVFRVDVNELLNKRFLHEEELDRSDFMLTKKVRRIRLAGVLPLKTYGKRQVLVVSSANPSLKHPEQLSEKEKERAKAYSFEYPRASLQSVCELSIAHKQDLMLAHQWHFVDSRFQCEWN